MPYTLMNSQRRSKDSCPASPTSYCPAPQPCWALPLPAQPRAPALLSGELHRSASYSSAHPKYWLLHLWGTRQRARWQLTVWLSVAIRALMCHSQCFPSHGWPDGRLPQALWSQTGADGSSGHLAPGREMSFVHLLVFLETWLLMFWTS